MSPRRREGILYALLVMVGWSFPGVFVRLMPHLAWNEATALRLTVAMAAVLPVVLIDRAKFRDALRSPACWRLALVMAAYYATATAAFVNAPVGEVALLIASAPAWAAVWHALSGHGARRNELLGAFTAIAGVTVVSIPVLMGHAPSNGNHPLGVVLAIASAACAAVYSIGVGRLHRQGGHPGPIPLGWMTFLVGFILLGPWSLARIPIGDVWPQALGIGLLCTAIPTVAYAAASERLPRGTTTLVNPTVSVTANLAAAVTIHELPSWWALPGGILVLAGVTMSLLGDQAASTEASAVSAASGE